MATALRPRYKFFATASVMRACGILLVFFFCGNRLWADDPGKKLEITGQKSLSTNQGQSITLRLSDLVVEAEPSLGYPSGFHLDIDKGDNYSASGSTITPAGNFVGELRVKVRVTNGKDKSNKFNLIIVVKKYSEPSNNRPVIVGQTSLSTFVNESITIQLSNLVVNDSDNDYPGDFTLTVLQGANYSVQGTTITPANNFKGTLQVKVKVNDGKDSSNEFLLAINVVEKGKLQIIGQKPLSTQEDKALQLKLSDLNVSDPDKRYPDGFSLVVQDGDHYSTSGTTLTPDKNFNGNLTAKVRVTRGNTSSDLVAITVVVTPVNDPPEFTTFDTEEISTRPDGEAYSISDEVTVSDVDNEKLQYAEVSLDSAGVQASLSATGTESIRAVFDEQEKILLLFGSAPLAEYESVLRSVTFQTTDSTLRRLVIQFRLSDGTALSSIHEKVVVIDVNAAEGKEEMLLDIPTGFTPNNDNANDTWVITSKTLSTNGEEMLLRVYNKHGVVVFESTSFDPAWDGKSNGTALPPDVYFYTIAIQGGDRPVNYKGIVSILR